jgi:DNA-directed RNA polymerase specialized sigma24 family protein
VEVIVRVFHSKQPDAAAETLYATPEDFCRIFEANMKRLYRLSLLLTADHELAGKCYVDGLEASKGGNPVFKEWAESWARRAIMINAIRMIHPCPADSVASSDPSPRQQRVEGLPSQLAAVAGLNPFDRFVFVMSVLEGYSERDCRLLLGCSSADVVEARIRALDELGRLAEIREKAAHASAPLRRTMSSLLCRWA